MNPSLRTLRVVMIGPIASGKGTLSGYIKKEYTNFVHISPGDILRREVQNNTELGQNVKEFLAKGLLVPDELVVNSIFNVLEAASEKNWILDGFPRTLDQAKILHGTIELDGKKRRIKRTTRRCPCDSGGLEKNPLTGVINLIVPDEVVIERTSNRWVHLPSGRVYSIGFREPRVKWKDDETGEDLVQRADDNPDVVRERLKLYQRVTTPLIDYYQKHHVQVLSLHNDNIDKIWATVKEFLDENAKKLDQQNN